MIREKIRKNIAIMRDSNFRVLKFSGYEGFIHRKIWHYGLKTKKNKPWIKADLNHWLWSYYDDLKYEIFYLLIHQAQSIYALSSIFCNINKLKYSFKNLNIK